MVSYHVLRSIYCSIYEHTDFSHRKNSGLFLFRAFSLLLLLLPERAARAFSHLEERREVHSDGDSNCVSPDMPPCFGRRKKLFG